MYAYAAAEKTTAAQTAPEGWPDGWDFPGTSVPPGWDEDAINWCGIGSTFSIRVVLTPYSVDWTVTGVELAYTEAGFADATYYPGFEVAAGAFWAETEVANHKAMLHSNAGYTAWYVTFNDDDVGTDGTYTLSAFACDTGGTYTATGVAVTVTPE